MSMEGINFSEDDLSCRVSSLEHLKQPEEGVCRSLPQVLHLHAGEARDTVGSGCDDGVIVLNISSKADSMLFHRLPVMELTAFENLDMILIMRGMRAAVPRPDRTSVLLL